MDVVDPIDSWGCQAGLILIRAVRQVTVIERLKMSQLSITFKFSIGMYMPHVEGHISNTRIFTPSGETAEITFELIVLSPAFKNRLLLDHCRIWTCILSNSAIHESSLNAVHSILMQEAFRSSCMPRFPSISFQNSVS